MKRNIHRIPFHPLPNKTRAIVLTPHSPLRPSQIHVPLSSPSPTDSFTADTITGASNSQDSLLPLPHLTPKTLLGGSNTARETVGQLYATQIASAILTRNPEEGRSLLVGLGLGKECFKMDGNGDGDGRREGFYDMVELVMKVIRQQ